MPTHTAPTPAPAWRPLAWLTALVVAVHLALLGLMPSSTSTDSLPLENKFITRTIVIAPPPAPAAEKPAPPAPPPPKVEVKRPPKPKPPAQAAPPQRASPQPAPKEVPAPEPTPVMAAPDATATQARSDAPAPRDSAPAGETGPVNSAGEAASAAGGGPNGSGAGAGAVVGTTPTAVHALQVHGSTRLSFELLGQRGQQPWKGVFGELVWLQDGNQYNAQLALKILFKTIRNQTSVGRIDANGVAPTRFSETRKTEVASHLVRDEGKVVFSTNAPTVPLLPGAQDRLSVVMQLGAMLAGDPARYPEGSKIAIQTVGPKDADVWIFNVEGTEQITVPSGEYSVRRLSRAPRSEYDYKLELWLAPELGYLPARMRQTQLDGDVIDLQLRSISDP
ncbi:DUF3108 domain-containing protein [Variovorax sp. J22R133]|uniref:DUF3108 domain-containing protein n=1 Tax=Variovorax brevis TaxID=3053503 RepID=UPI00257854EF|nr:DUF3108 domain-containing protein [Variovorax sp. J22R133]MDM0115746.1 DUF3108 domain-containing protein [Variovorax sp. J22R133]